MICGQMPRRQGHHPPRDRRLV